MITHSLALSRQQFFAARPVGLCIAPTVQSGRPSVTRHTPVTWQIVKLCDSHCTEAQYSSLTQLPSTGSGSLENKGVWTRTIRHFNRYLAASRKRYTIGSWLPGMQIQMLCWTLSVWPQVIS